MIWDARGITTFFCKNICTLVLVHEPEWPLMCWWKNYHKTKCFVFLMQPLSRSLIALLSNVSCEQNPLTSKLVDLRLFCMYYRLQFLANSCHPLVPISPWFVCALLSSFSSTLMHFFHLILVLSLLLFSLCIHWEINVEIDFQITFLPVSHLNGKKQDAFLYV